MGMFLTSVEMRLSGNFGKQDRIEQGTPRDFLRSPFPVSWHRKCTMPVAVPMYSAPAHRLCAGDFFPASW